MSHRKINNALHHGLNVSLPDVLDSVLQAKVCNITAEEYEALMSPPAELSQQKIKLPKPRLAFNRPSLVFSFIAILLCLGLWSYQKPAALIAIDVNPSFEVTTNAYKRVIQVNGLDQNSQELLTGLKLKNKSLDTTIETLMDSLIQNGYLEQTDNTILVSVATTNESLSKAMEVQILKDMNQVLESDNKAATIYVQTLDQEIAPASQNRSKEQDSSKLRQEKQNDNKDNFKKLEKSKNKEKQPANKSNNNIKKDQENLSFGKATLIKKLLNHNVPFTQKELANMSLQEIKTLLNQYDTDMQTILDQKDKTKKNKDNKGKEEKKPSKQENNPKNKGNEERSKSKDKDKDNSNNKSKDNNKGQDKKSKK